MQVFLKRWRYPYLAVVGALTLFFGYQSLFRLQVEQDNRSMNADHAGQMLVEEEFNDLFPSGDSLLVAVHRDSGLLDDSGKMLIRELADQFRCLDGVEQVSSLADSDFLVLPWFEDLLISEDRKVAGLQITLKDFSDDGDSLSEAIDGVRSIAAKFADDTEGVETFLSGLTAQKDENGRLVRSDQRLFTPVSFLVLGAVLLLITRRLSGMVIPLLVSALTICWTMGILSLAGFSLNMVTSLLQPVIMTLAIATTIHIYIEWLHGRERNNHLRIAAAVKTLYRPCLFASLTTCLGFLSLMTSHTPAVRQFGLFAALGVAIAYVLGVTGMAVGLSFIKTPPSPPQRRTPAIRGLLSRALKRSSNLAVKHPRSILLVTCIATIVSVIGMQKVRSDTDLLSFIGRDSQLYHDTRFIDEHLTGVNTIELLITRSDGNEFDRFEAISRIQDFQAKLDELGYIRHSMSVVDLLATAGIDPQTAQGPFSAIAGQLELQDFLAADFRTLRITLRCAAIGSASGAQLIDEIRAAADSTLGAEFEMREAGDFYRVISESNQIVSTQITSFAIAIGLILIAIGVVFRSFLFMLLAIIPSVIPLLMTAAIMGFSGIELSTGTAMIASVVIGIAVDDTIHYLAAFRRAYRSQSGDGDDAGDCDRALESTTRLTGLALTSTTLALSIGFWVAILGSFQPTVYFALLSGLTMWFALICDLLALPAGLHLVFARKHS